MGRIVYATAVAVWLGTVVSFSYVFLPVVHAVLQGADARAMLGRMFPRYYLVGLCCGLVAMAAVSLAPDTPALPLAERARLASPVAVSLLCTLAAYQGLLPRLLRLRRQDEPQRYQKLHQFSAMLNSTVLAMLVLAMVATVTR